MALGSSSRELLPYQSVCLLLVCFERSDLAMWGLIILFFVNSSLACTMAVLGFATTAKTQTSVSTESAGSQQKSSAQIHFGVVAARRSAEYCEQCMW